MHRSRRVLHTSHDDPRSLFAQAKPAPTDEAFFSCAGTCVINVLTLHQRGINISTRRRLRWRFMHMTVPMPYLVHAVTWLVGVASTLLITNLKKKKSAYASFYALACSLFALLQVTLCTNYMFPSSPIHVPSCAMFFRHPCSDFFYS